MAEQPDTLKVLDDLSKSNAARPSARTERQKRTALKRIALILIFISPLLLGLVFLAYQQWSLRQDLGELAEENSQLNQVISNDNERVRQLQSLLDQQAQLTVANPADMTLAQEGLNRELERLNLIIAELREQLRQGQANTGIYRDMTELESLMRAASQRLQVDRDVDGAILMLETADRMLEESRDGSDLLLRESIRNDLALLRNVQTVDTEDLYLRISSVISGLAAMDRGATSLPDFQQRLQSAATDRQTAASVSRGPLQFLSSIFIWRKWDEAPDLSLHPERLEYQHQSLVLQLEQAQLALMNHQGAIYHSSLQRSVELLEALASQGNPQIRTLQREVQALSTVELDPLIPDISESLVLIRQRISDASGR